jgi:hypothetical protein
MPINVVRHNPAALALAKATLLDHASQLLGDTKAFSGGNGRLAMLPVYSMPATQLADRRWNRGWRSGWRYYWTHPDLEQGLVVEITRVTDNKVSLCSVSCGQQAVWLRERLGALTAQFIEDKRRFRPRVLSLPWIQMEALWLNTDSLRVQDKFYSQLDDLQNRDFIEEAIKRCRAYLGLKPTKNGGGIASRAKPAP